ncbi:phage tail tip lysozyme [Mesorhizobium sp. Z1-4]|uniref:phage tail tip lysozyme n=1 Tax=Mesorhizobium sp. Z1-4 TaxID=2448478 RepID=UPI000FDBC04B|nr:phage tail tip lysozyme [Mesorhizobium sp. Z1-4]
MNRAQQEAHFRTEAPWLIDQLMRDFPFDELGGAAVAGNGGWESKGFTDMQEDKPLVPGSRGGGYRWQWTGPRRRAFEDYCKRNGYDPTSKESNYKWLFLELRGGDPASGAGDESAAVAAILSAGTLRDKVVAFEKHFERPAKSHVAGRLKWAEIALDAWRAAKASAPIPNLPVPVPEGLLIPAEAGEAALVALARQDDAKLETAAQTIALARAYKRGVRIVFPSAPLSTIDQLLKGETMEGVKKWFQSKGVLGGLGAIAMLIGPIFGLDLGQAEINETQVAINNLVAAVSALVGIWGRVSAGSRIG